METTGMPKCHNPDGSIQASMADGVILLVETMKLMRNLR
jgi:hypothetical protein